MFCYTRLLFGGRQPLCGNGVTSLMDVICKPETDNALIADSRPAPGPLTSTDILTIPIERAVSATF
jgi:hypothetical protein